MNSLALFNPNLAAELWNTMDDDFADFFPTVTTGAKRGFVPSVDVMETKENYILDMDLPGLTEKDVEINLKNRILSISSKKEEKKVEKKEGDWLIKERRSSSFTRKFTLPDDIDADKVNATFTNGVLKITIPRKTEEVSKKIAITAA